MRDEQQIAGIIEKEFGANATYVEDLFRQYRQQPGSVGEEWERYFGGLLGGNGGPPAMVSREEAGAAVPVQRQSQVAPAGGTGAVVEPPVERIERVTMRGPAARIVENMESSLGVPTATSIRQIQIKLLDENRRWINRYLEAQGRPKTSFTHFIAWAMLKAIAKYPQLNDGYQEVEGAPTRLRREEVHLGVAVDVQKKDGTRTLLVPNLKAANHLRFREFLDAYQDVITRARNGKLQVADFQGTTISLTNPGTIGTTASSPRLMAGQGLILATGAIEFPPEYAAMTEAALSQLGIGKVLTITSTYDHRIIQGAESGLFLAYLHELLLGKHGFYDEIFADLGITYRPRADSEAGASLRVDQRLSGEGPPHCGYGSPRHDSDARAPRA
jgi:2-oxoglutarate decarboxylase